MSVEKSIRKQGRLKDGIGGEAKEDRRKIGGVRVRQGEMKSTNALVFVCMNTPIAHALTTRRTTTRLPDL